MISDELVKEVTKIEKYLIKQNRYDIVKELKTLNPEQLKKKIMEYAMARQEIADAKANDEELNTTKEKAKNLAAPYNESKRLNDKIARFISLTLKDKVG